MGTAHAVPQLGKYHKVKTHRTNTKQVTTQSNTGDHYPLRGKTEREREWHRQGNHINKETTSARTPYGEKFILNTMKRRRVLYTKKTNKTKLCRERRKALAKNFNKVLPPRNQSDSEVIIAVKDGLNFQSLAELLDPQGKRIWRSPSPMGAKV